jgi:hypothetical protein
MRSSYAVPSHATVSLPSGQVFYRDVWWRHDAAGLRDPMLAEIEEALG